MYPHQIKNKKETKTKTKTKQKTTRHLEVIISNDPRLSIVLIKANPEAAIAEIKLNVLFVKPFTG